MGKVKDFFQKFTVKRFFSGRYQEWSEINRQWKEADVDFGKLLFDIAGNLHDRKWKSRHIHIDIFGYGFNKQDQNPLLTSRQRLIHGNLIRILSWSYTISFRFCIMLIHQMRV